MNNLALCESKSLREEQLREVSQDRALEILDKAKALVMALHQGVGVATTEEVAEYFEVSVETIKSVAKTNRDELAVDGLKVLRGKDLKEVRSLIHLASQGNTFASSLAAWTPRSMLRCGMLLRDSLVAKHLRTMLLEVVQKGGASAADLERQFKQLVPIPSLKEIAEAGKIFGSMHGEAYQQRYVHQKIKQHYPGLEGQAPNLQELASLVTTKALLTPTQIAKELNLLCAGKPYNPSAQKANNLLEQLGYQIKLAGVWSATQKAIAANLVDRKPVSTGSSTQKDQLLWSADIIPILQEHTTSAQQHLDLHAKNR